MIAPIFTVGELRASRHVHKDLRREIRDNLLAALAAGRDPWPGMFGFSRTVLPQLSGPCSPGTTSSSSANADRARPGSSVPWPGCWTNGRR